MHGAWIFDLVILVLTAATAGIAFRQMVAEDQID
jgi:hypothetical protein